jgi:oligosaccharide repeat unit polymerase
MLRIIILVTLLFASISLYFIYPDGMDKELFIINFGVLFIILGVFISRKEKVESLKKQFLKHSNLFVLGFVIVHFQFYMDYLLSNTTKNNTYVWYDINVVNNAFILSLTGLIAFFLGYFIFFFKQYKTPKTKLYKKSSTLLLSYFSLVFLVVFYATVNPLYLAGFYGSVTLDPITIYAQFGFQICVFAALIQNTRNLLGSSGNILEKKYSFIEFVKSQGLLFNCTVAIYLIGVVASGDRGPVMSVLLCYISNYIFLTKKKYSFKNIAFFVIAGAFIITILGQVRLMDKDISFKERFFIALSGDYVNLNREAENSISPSTKELATSVKTVHIALATVPNQHDFFFGQFQSQLVLGAIPFGTDLKNLVFDDNSYKYINSGKFITWTVFGDFYIYELGSSCIADLYLDLGIIGVVIGMFLFGIFLRKCERGMLEMNYVSLFFHVFIIVYFCFSIYLSRSMLLFNVKLCIYIYIVLSVFNIFNLKTKRG